jgi:hypothetical protein
MVAVPLTLPTKPQTSQLSVQSSTVTEINDNQDNFIRRQELESATVLPLVVADESTGGPFVVGGAVRIPAERVTEALAAIDKIKEARGVAPDAKIHCRVLFAGSARLKSPFKHLDIAACEDLISQCVVRLNALGAQWTGCYVNADLYPSELRLLEGTTFAVSKKHLAGLVAFGALKLMDDISDPNYRLAFDPDSTRLDWGLLQRTQATHYARIDPRVVRLTSAEVRLLDVADVAAYSLVQTLLCKIDPHNRKHWHKRFPELVQIMQMRTASFAYEPSR